MGHCAPEVLGNSVEELSDRRALPQLIIELREKVGQYLLAITQIGGLEECADGTVQWARGVRPASPDLSPAERLELFSCWRPVVATLWELPLDHYCLIV